MKLARAHNLLPKGFLHTEAARVVAADGTVVHLAGVNWYGFECEWTVPGGLDVRAIDDMSQLIVDLGFNHLRLPFCDEVVRRNPQVGSGLAAMPALQGRRALDVMDAVIGSAGRHGLKVVLDDHRSDPAWSAQGNGLWYSRAHSPRAWRQTLTDVARRYRGDDTVVGIDLRNEPGAPPTNKHEYPRNGGALWGVPDRWLSRHPRDWAAAAEQAGNAILACNPDLLIIVEGVRGDPAGPVYNGTRHLYWSGGNLIGVDRPGGRRRQGRPIKLDVDGRLVYSVHDYGPAMHAQMPWCQPGTTARTADACRSVWDQTWGFIVRRGLAPIYVGEFGTPNRLGRQSPHAARHMEAATADGAQQRWFSYLIDYIAELGLSWAYWPLNGRNSPGGGRHPDQIERYGLLDPDYGGPSNPSLLAQLNPIQRL
jgi:endoglucanase